MSTAIERAKKIRTNHNITDDREIDLTNPSTNAFVIIKELEDFIKNFPD